MIRLAAILVSAILSAPLFAADTILVLPFFNAGKARNYDWIGDSISETMLDSLAAEGLSVVAPEVRDQAIHDLNVRRYAILTRASVMEIAVNADASFVVYGEFEVTPPPPPGGTKEALRIGARILDVRHVRRRGEFSLTGAVDDLSSTQNALAWRVLGVFAPDRAHSEEQFRRTHPTVRNDALENYIRGLRATTPEQKNKFLSTAARLAPSFSQPCFQLGRLNFGTRNYQAAAVWFEKVAQLDLHYREALFYLGLSRYYLGEFKSAADALRKLAGLIPLPEVLNNLGAVLVRLGDAEAVPAFQKAIETDPADPDYYFNAGYALWRRGDFAAAADSFRASLQRKPDDENATLLLGRCLQQSGPRPGDVRTEALERVKSEYNEAAWFALKAMLAPRR